MKLYTKKEIVRKYYKYGNATWTQPVLTSKGTLGGSSFAVYCSGEESSHEIYKAFDNNSSTFATTHKKDLILYNPIPLNITHIQTIQKSSPSYNIQYLGGTIQGSGDNINWEDIVTIGANLSEWDLSSNTKYYKYYKIPQRQDTGDWQPTQINITATQQTIIESTSSDYDFYKDVEVYKMPKKTVTKYWKYIYVDKPWTQPILSSNGTLGGSSFAVYCPSDQTSSYPPYRAFDGKTGTQVVTHGTPFTIYNPIPLNITKFQLTHDASWQRYKGGTIQGSDDNINWEDIVTIGSDLITWDLSSNTKYYKYYKILQPNGGDFQPHLIDLTATQQITEIIEATEDDYDFTTQEEVYYASMQGAS